MTPLFRAFVYAAMGLSLEVVFSTTLLSIALGYRVTRRVDRKYAEGFVSLYMIPIHAVGVLLGFETVLGLIGSFPMVLRYAIWGIGFAATEAGFGFLIDKILGFYPWDYYSKSRFRVFERGYTLWTLIPLWGMYGLFCEVIARTLGVP